MKWIRRRFAGGNILLLSLASAACGGEEPSAECALGNCSTAAAYGPDAGDSEGTADPDGDGQAGTTGSDTGAVTSNADAGGNSETGAPTVKSADALPCDVQTIVAEHCQRCHSDPPVGTFMPLVTASHFQAPSTSDPDRPYRELAIERLHAPTNPMPPIVEQPLDAAELATLSRWLEGGALPGDETCATGDGAGAGGANNGPGSGQDVDTSGLECHQFLAHEPNDPSEKFHVGVAVDAYFNMVFQAPWDGTPYGVVIKPVTDNAQVLHHWILYREPGAGADGAVSSGSGQHGSAEMVHGWAPGGFAMDFRDYGDVGFELPSTTYVLELHYNSDDPEARDASGVEVCFKREKPEHVAALSWLGLDYGAESYVAGGVFGTALSGTCLAPSDEWVSTCDPVSEEPIHLMFVNPHMHQTGVHTKAVIDGPNGSRVLHDMPFDFNYQITYPVNEILMPGETITTTCSFSEPKCSGQATNAEMCYLYTYAYPKGALRDNGPWGQFAHGENTCLGQ